MDFSSKPGSKEIVDETDVYVRGLSSGGRGQLMGFGDCSKGPIGASPISSKIMVNRW